MSENSKIEWCDHTFNPWIGCTKVSTGCDHCYAECSTPSRVQKVAWGPGAPRRRTSSANWRKPVAWNARHGEFFAAHSRRQRIFCASLADVFDNAVDPAWRADLFDLIEKTPNLDWLLLTKRIGNVLPMITDTAARRFDLQCLHEPSLPDNVWLGATIVNQEEADRDIAKLLEVPAAVRFLSIEPMLGPINLTRWLDPTGITCMDVCPDTPFVDVDKVETTDAGSEVVPLCPHCGEHASWTGYDDGIDWVICGGESGPYARITHPEWPRDLRDQCASAGVPFLFKQHGEWAPGSGDFGAGRFRTAAIARDGRVVGGGFDAAEYPPDATSTDGWAMVHRVGKKAAGRLLNGVEHNHFPDLR